MKYEEITCANVSNLYLKKQFRKEKKYRTAVLVKDVLAWVMNHWVMNRNPLMTFSEAIAYIDWKKVKAISKDDGVSYKKVRNILDGYFYEIEDSIFEYGFWSMPATKDVIKKL